MNGTSNKGESPMSPSVLDGDLLVHRPCRWYERRLALLLSCRAPHLTLSHLIFQGRAEIRKPNKDEQMKKKRQITGANGLTVSSSTTEELKTRIAENMEVFHRIFLNPGIVIVEDLLTAVKDLRRLLSVERNSSVDLIIDAGALRYFVAFLTNNKYPMLQFEAAWALTNIASTSRTKDVADYENAVPALVKILHSPDDNVREQAIQCIGIIAGESVSFRDRCLHEPGLIEGL
jgi:importin subunit alpha-1